MLSRRSVSTRESLHFIEVGLNGPAVVAEQVYKAYLQKNRKNWRKKNGFQVESYYLRAKGNRSKAERNSIRGHSTI